MIFTIESKYHIGEVLYKSVKDGILKVEVTRIHVEYDTASKVPVITYSLRVLNKNNIIGGVMHAPNFTEKESEVEDKYCTTKEKLIEKLFNGID